MSSTRLEKHDKRQSRKHIALFVGILIFVGVFLVNAGIPLLINGSALLGSKFISRSDVIDDPDAQPIFISVDRTPQATSSASLVITGSIDNVDEIRVYINGLKKDTVDVDGDDFELKAVGLKPGKNEIVLQAQNTDTSRSQKSDVLVVDYLSQKPELEISSPDAESTTLENNVQIKGSTNDATNTIRINNAPVVVNAKGEFSHSYRLQTGDNTIKVTAQNAAGQQTQVELKVKREK
jgi:hypothetical protein